MPPKKDEFKYVDINMSIADLKQIATHVNIDIKSLKRRAQLLKAIRSVDPPFPNKYNLLRNKWSSDPADATEPSTAAQPTEEPEDPRDDKATEIQKVVRGMQGRKKAANLKQDEALNKNSKTEQLKTKKEQENAINTIQKITRGRKARAEVADLDIKVKADATYKNRYKVAIEKGKEKARAQAAPTAAAPAAPPVVAVIPRAQAKKDKDEGPPEEGQFKKITRKNVGDIDDNVKVHIKSNVSPTVNASAIAKQMQIINQRRFKIGHANIIYHRLGGISKKATDFL